MPSEDNQYIAEAVMAAVGGETHSETGQLSDDKLQPTQCDVRFAQCGVRNHGFGTSVDARSQRLGNFPLKNYWGESILSTYPKSTPKSTKMCIFACIISF